MTATPPPPSPSAPPKAPAEEPFILLAMASLVAATAWLALRPGLLLQFFYSAEMLALTHLLTLGCVSSLIMGMLLRMAPPSLGFAPRSARLAWLQFGLFVIGASGMVSHFALGSWVGLAWSTPFVLAAALVQLWNLAGIWRRAASGEVVAWHVAAALVHLALAAWLGMSFGFLKAHGTGASWLTAQLLDRLAAHLHLALVGWVTTMIVGLQLVLLPAACADASSGESPRDGAGSRGPALLRFGLLQVGLVAVVVSLLAGRGAPLWGAAAMAAALLAHVGAGLRALLRREGARAGSGARLGAGARVRAWAWAWAWDAVALGLLAVLVVVGLALAAGWPDPGSELRLRVEFAYGLLAFYGWVVLTISATAFRVFPGWVAAEVRAAGGPELEPSRLFSPTLRHAGSALLAGGALGAAGGMVAGLEPLVAVSAWALLAGVAAFVANFLRMARHGLLAGRRAGRS